MKPKVWHPAEDTMLLVMRRRNANAETLAARFGCTPVEALKRVEELETQHHKAVAGPTLPSKEEVEEMRKNMDPVQRAFMDMCTTYNEMGEMLRLFSTFVSTRLAPEEMEKMIIDCFEEPRLPNETIHQKLARTLAKRCIIIPTMTEYVDPQPMEQKN